MEYKRLYLAYGSNINLEQMAYRCPTAKVIGATMLPNQELNFRRVATIDPKEGSEVPVLVWEIGQQDEINLDYYEGFPRMYRKEIFELEVNGKMRECMAYVMNHGAISPPSSQYYNGIKLGYEANGMDTSYLRAALERAVQYVQGQAQEDEDIEEDMEETDDMQLRME